MIARQIASVWEDQSLRESAAFVSTVSEHFEFRLQTDTAHLAPEALEVLKNELLEVRSQIRQRPDYDHSWAPAGWVAGAASVGLLQLLDKMISRLPLFRSFNIRNTTRLLGHTMHRRSDHCKTWVMRMGLGKGGRFAFRHPRVASSLVLWPIGFGSLYYPVLAPYENWSALERAMSENIFPQLEDSISSKE
jgi:hypothetical protein